MASGIGALLSLLAVLLPLLVAAWHEARRRRRGRYDDTVLLDSDPTRLSVELDRLFREAGGAPGQPSAGPGDHVRPDG